MDTIELERLKQLEGCVPDIWEYSKYLYIGANWHRFHFSDKLRDKSVHVVEVDQDRCRELDAFPWIDRITCADISAFSGSRAEFDVAIWSHGPSCMVTNWAAIKAIKELQRIADIVVLMCPWGKYKNAENTFIYDMNHLDLTPEFFHALNFKTSCLGAPDTNGSNLLAWYVAE